MMSLYYCTSYYQHLSASVHVALAKTHVLPPTSSSVPLVRCCITRKNIRSITSNDVAGRGLEEGRERERGGS